MGILILQIFIDNNLLYTFVEKVCKCCQWCHKNAIYEPIVRDRVQRLWKIHDDNVQRRLTVELVEFSLVVTISRELIGTHSSACGGSHACWLWVNIWCLSKWHDVTMPDVLEHFGTNRGQRNRTACRPVTWPIWYRSRLVMWASHCMITELPFWASFKVPYLTLFFIRSMHLGSVFLYNFNDTAQTPIHQTRLNTCTRIQWSTVNHG